VRLFLLALLGLLIGCTLTWWDFPLNLALPIFFFVLIMSIRFPAQLVVVLLGVSTMRILWLAGGIAPQELVYSFAFLFLLGISFIREFVRVKEELRPAWATPVALPIFCLGLVGIGATGVAILRGHLFAHWASDLNFILFFWLYFVVCFRFGGVRDIYRILWPTFWITIGVIVWALGKRLITQTLFVGLLPRFSRGAGFSSTLFLLSVCLFLFAEKGSLKRVGFFVASCFFGIHQFLSFVRTLWVAQIGTFGFLLLFLPFMVKRRFVRWTGILFLLASLLLSFSWVAPTDDLLVKMPTFIMNRFLSIFTDVTGAGPSMRTRYAEWEAALKKFMEHPLTGNGLGTQIQFIRYDYARLPLTTERYIHSSFIYYLLNTGPLGLAVFLWFCFCAVSYGIGVYRRAPTGELKGLALGMTSSLFFQILNSIASSELNHPARTIWTGFFLGALAVIDREARQLKESAG